MTSQSEPKHSPEPGAASRRVHRRVSVALRVAVVLGKDTAYLGHTQNMSESGLLISDYSGPELQRGRLVGVNLRGVVGDDADDDSHQYLMRVVRHSGNELALRFASETD